MKILRYLMSTVIVLASCLVAAPTHVQAAGEVGTSKANPFTPSTPFATIKSTIETAGESRYYFAGGTYAFDDVINITASSTASGYNFVMIEGTTISDKPIFVAKTGKRHFVVDASFGALGGMTFADVVLQGPQTPTAGVDNGGIAATANFDSTTLYFNSSILRDCSSATTGGGISAASGKVSVSGSTISGNKAGGYGGGIYAPKVSVSTSCIDNNISGAPGTANGNGGGVYASGACRVNNSTVALNQAHAVLSDGQNGLGGGVYGKNVLVVQSTFSGNFARNSGGGIYAPDTYMEAGSTLEIYWSIVVANYRAQASKFMQSEISRGYTHDVGDGSVQDKAYSGNGYFGRQNLIGYTSTGPEAIMPITSFSIPSVETSKQKAGKLADNGGSIRTIMILPGSAAQDVASKDQSYTPQYAGFPNAIPQTQDGDVRGISRIENGLVDIGAVELPTNTAPDYVVTTTSSDPAVSGSLPWAVKKMHDDAWMYAAGTEKTIRFDSGVTGAITLQSAMSFKDPVKLIGPGADKLTLTVNGDFRHIYNTSETQVTVSGLTFQGRGGTYSGGGICAQYLVMNDCVVKDNRAGEGGGIAVYKACVISDSTISNNTASVLGGGIYAHNIDIRRCTIDGNTAHGGGGLHVTGFLIESCTISNNTARNGGGGVCAVTASVDSVVNCTISGNVGADGAGAIYFDLTNYGSFINLAIDCLTISGNVSKGKMISTIGGEEQDVAALDIIVVGNYDLDGGENNRVELLDNVAYELASQNVIPGNGNMENTIETENVALPGTNGIERPVGKLADNGGPTKTIRPIEGGLAHNYSNNNNNARKKPYDQRGYPRMDGANDAGAVELQAAPVYSIAGTVTGSDAPGGLAATLQLKQGGQNIGSPVTANTQGQYSIVGVPAGNGYTIEVSMTGYTTSTIASFDITTANATGKNIQLNKITAATYQVSGTVSTSNGAANMALVQLKNGAGQNVGSPVYTNPSGGYTIAGVPAGNGYTIVASMQGCETGATTPFNVVDAHVTGRDITLADAPVYRASSTPAGKTFDAADGGYSSIGAQQFIIKNTGNRPLTGLNATLDKGAVSPFEIITGPGASLAVDAESTISLRPKDGLATGTHTDTLLISSSEGNVGYISLSFSVNKTLQSVQAPAAITGLAHGTAKTAAGLKLPANVVLVTNGGNANAAVTWDVNACSYDAAKPDAQTFTVNGTAALPAGVGNSNGVSLNVSVQVTVNAKPEDSNQTPGDDDTTNNDPQPESKAGWQKVGGQWHYYAADGKPLTGWQKLDWDGRVDWYYFSHTGAMDKGWKKLGGKWYWLGTNGRMATGYEQVDGRWSYFKASGAWTGYVKNTGWRKYSKGWSFRANGKWMKNGWCMINGNWYLFDSAGYMKTGWVRSGKTWYYLKSSGAMARNEWVKSGGKQYWLDNGGAMVTRDTTINGKVNAFNSSGVWQGVK